MSDPLGGTKVRSSLRVTILVILFLLACVAMYFAVFIEYATSATGEYRFSMTLGLLAAALSDSLLYWVYANGRRFARIAAVAVSLAGSMLVLADWIARGPSVFRHG